MRLNEYVRGFIVVGEAAFPFFIDPLREQMGHEHADESDGPPGVATPAAAQQFCDLSVAHIVGRR